MRRPAYLVLLGLLALSACAEGIGLGGPAETDRAILADGPAGTVTVVAPPGYCVDRRTLRHAPRGGFALLARCDTLGIGSLFANRRLALITVTTAPMAEGTKAPSLNALKQSVAPAEVLESRVIDRTPMVRLAHDPDTVRGLSPEHWRGVFALNDQLVALAIYVPESSAIPAGEASSLLADVASRTRMASPAAPLPAVIRRDPAFATAKRSVRPRARPPG